MTVLTPASGTDLLPALRSLVWQAPSRVAFLVEKPQPGVHVLRDEVVVRAGSGFAGDHPRKSWWRGRIVPGRDVTATAFEVLRLMNLAPDLSGDNLVTAGVDLASLGPGDVLYIGNVRLERSEKPHRPCALFRDRAGQAAFEAAAAGYRGALFHARTAGVVRVHDPIRVVRRVA